MFRQTFLFQYNILSVQAHNIRNIFLTAGQQNRRLFHTTLLLFRSRKLVQKKVCEKMENKEQGTTLGTETPAFAVGRISF